MLRIYDEALARECAERAAYLDTACGADADLRRDVEALLAEPSAGSRSLLDTPPWAPPAFEAGRRLGHYEIISVLGAGGMGAVYKARDTRLERTVAIKVLSGVAALDSAARDRFTREARAIAALDHPNICTLYDVGREGLVDYLVMEYLEGDTLAGQLCQAGRCRSTSRWPSGCKLRTRSRWRTAKASSTGIEAGERHVAGEQGPRGAPVVKLLDFGLAKAMRRVPRPG